MWWLVVVAVAGVAAALTGWASTAQWRQALAGGCAAATVLLLSWALLLRRQVRAERAERAREHRLAAARGAEMAHLATVRVPAIAERVRAGRRLDGVPGPVAPPADTGEDFALAVADVVTALGSDEAVRRERGLRDSVQAAFESVARTMHAMATVQQQVLDEVERAIDDPRLMADVMKADHAASQMTRKAQTLLVMCGIWPARREARPVSLYDCVRGAQSRIVEFGRVEVHGGQTLFVVPPAVEGLMHAIAELLENATVFSPSRTQVVVTIREVGAGAVVEVDDAGLGMPPDILHQAMSQLRNDLDLTRLGAVPRLGLACVGRWSRELGFNVELTGASAYGGTRAVSFVPHRLLTEPLSHFPPERGEQEAAREETAAYGMGPAHAVREHERPTAPATGATGTTGDTDTIGDTNGSGEPGLPRRRSRRRTPNSTTAAGRSAGQAGQAGQPGRSAAQERVRDRGQAPSEQASQRQPARQAQPDPSWTPEAARASITSVVSGSRRGRAAVQDSEVPDQYEGGRQ